MELAKQVGLSERDTLMIQRSGVPVGSGDKDAIFQVLYRWTKDLTISPPLECFVHALESLGFDEISGKDSIFIASFNALDNQDLENLHQKHMKFFQDI